MSKKIVALVTLSVLLTTPLMVLAIDVSDITQPETGDVIGFTFIINGLLNRIVWPVAVGVVVTMFILAGIIFLTAQGEPGKIATARAAVTWGIIGVIVILISFSIITTLKWYFTDTQEDVIAPFIHHNA